MLEELETQTEEEQPVMTPLEQTPGWLYGSEEQRAKFATATAPATTEDFASTFVKPLERPAIPTDQEMADLYQRAPLMTEEERQASYGKVQSYYDNQERQATAKRRSDRERMLLNPEAKAEFYQTPDLLDAAANTGHPQEMWDRHVVTNILENDILHRPLQPGEYEPAKNKYIGLNMAGQPVIGDTEAAGVLKKHEEINKEGDTLFADASTEITFGHATALSPGGKPYQVGETYEKMAARYPEFVKGREKQVYDLLREQDREVADFTVRNQSAIKAGLEYFNLVNTGATSAQTDLAQQAVTDAFMGVAPEDQKKVFGFVVNAAKMGVVDKSAINKAAGFLGELLVAAPARGAYRFFSDKVATGSWFANAENKDRLKNGEARMAPDGTIIYDPTVKVDGARRMTPEEITDAAGDLERESMALVAENNFTSAYREVYKYKAGLPEDWLYGVPAKLEEGAVGFMENAPIMAMNMTPWGRVIYTVSVGSQYFRQMMVENPGMDNRVAGVAAYLGAGQEAVWEGFKVETLMSASLRGLFTTLRTKGPVAYFRILLGTNVAENTMEGIQDFGSAATLKLTQEIAHAIDPSMNVGKIQSWNDLMADWVQQRPDVAYQVFFGAFIASGVGTYKHLNDPVRQLYNEETLKGTWQLTQKQVDELLSMPRDRWAERDQKFKEMVENRTPEQRADAVVYGQKVAEEARKGADSTVDDPRATLEPATLPDGTRVWHVKDEDGNIVRENLQADVALEELGAYQDLIDKEQILKQAEAHQTEDETARTIESEAKWAFLKDEDKVATRNVLDFSYVAPSTPEQQTSLSSIEKIVADRNAKYGFKDTVTLVAADEPTTRAGLGASNFIKWFEGTFGKRVQFVAAKDGQPLSFVGMVDPSNPDTIFLDAAGDRNVLAALGHEWSHTVEHTNPVLWQDMVGQLKPLVVDWAKQTGKLPSTYDASQADSEFVANVVGDAFGDEQFWATVRAQQPGLFQRMLEAITQWFDSLVGVSKSSEWGTQAPDVLKDVQAVRDLIAKAMTKVKEGAETAMTEETYTEGPHGEVVTGQAAEPRAYPDEVDVSDAQKEGAYWMDRAGRIYDVDFTTDGHAGWAEKNLGVSAQEAFNRGWVRVVTHNKLVYWNGLDASNAQKRSLNDIGAQLNWAVFHDPLRGYSNEGQAAVPRSYEAMKPGTEPKKTRTAYKLFRLKDGQLFPLFIDSNVSIPIGKWLAAKFVRTKGEQYADRPGWHAGHLPYAPHLRTKEIPGGMRAGERVWAEVQMGADVDWQPVADQSPTHDIKNRVPKGGSYLFKTSKVQGGAWILGGELRVVSVMSDSDVARVLTESGNADQIDAETRKMGQAAEPRGGAHKFGRPGVRQVDENGGYLTPDDEILVDKSINAALDKEKITPGAGRNKLFQQAREQAHADILSTRARFPDKPTATVTDPWDALTVNGATVEFVDSKEGEPSIKKTVGKYAGQPYRFDQIPEGMTKEQWSADLSNRVVGQFIERLQKGYREGATAKERAGAALIVKELEWYREFITKLRQDFGGAADFMADLMGAYSPRQNVQLNWRNAIDTIWGISSGKYDDLLSEIDAYLKASPEHTMKTWRDKGGATMRARSGALFGTNTDLGHYAALGMWRAVQAGDAPKAKNFTRNLIALSYRATIDVWAARLLDRVAGKPRIPTEAEGAVAGHHMTSSQLKKAFGDNVPLDIPIVGQFAFGQEVFEQVAAHMRDPATWANSGLPADVVAAFANVTAADVQATNWFVEKEIWTDNNWTNEEGSGGSFIHEIENMVGSRFQVGLSQQVTGRDYREDFLPQDPEQAEFAKAVRASLAKAMPDVISMRAMDTLGVFKDYPPERSLDIELTHGPGMEPNDLMRVVLQHAAEKDQESTFISRVMDPWEPMENARPGIEVMFREGIGMDHIKAAAKHLTDRGINGFTMVVDQRGTVGAQEFIGVRFQYVPEYSGDGPKWAKNAKKIRDLLADATGDILKMDGVASVDIRQYDTVVFEKGKHYDIDGVNSGTVGTSQATAWRRRYFDAVSRKATKRNARDVATEELDVLHREQVQQQAAESASKRVSAVPVTMFDAGLMQFTERNMTPTKDLVTQLRAEASALGEILKCLQS